jgi:hypothetical protein
VIRAARRNPVVAVVHPEREREGQQEHGGQRTDRLEVARATSCCLS